MRRRPFMVVVSSLVAGVSGCTGRDSTENASASTRPPASDALAVTESYPIQGTMVNVGVGGTCTNSGSVPLVDCVVVAEGEVGDQTFSERAQRDRLAVDEVWEWEVSFGEEADALQEDSVDNIVVTTQAAYDE